MRKQTGGFSLFYFFCEHKRFREEIGCEKRKIKIKNARSKRRKVMFFNVKYANVCDGVVASLSCLR